MSTDGRLFCVSSTANKKQSSSWCLIYPNGINSGPAHAMMNRRIPQLAFVLLTLSFPLGAGWPASAALSGPKIRMTGVDSDLTGVLTGLGGLGVFKLDGPAGRDSVQTVDEHADLVDKGSGSTFEYPGGCISVFGRPAGAGAVTLSAMSDARDISCGSAAAGVFQEPFFRDTLEKTIDCMSGQGDSPTATLKALDRVTQRSWLGEGCSTAHTFVPRDSAGSEPDPGTVAMVAAAVALLGARRRRTP